MEDPYKILGVSTTASADEIKSAYRKLARKLHPDVNPGNKGAEDQFKRATAAYDLLSDADKRARFDRGEIDAMGTEKARYRSYANAGGKGGFGGGKSSSPGGGNFDFDFGSDADDILSELLRRKERGRTTWNFRADGTGGPQKGPDQKYSLRVSFTEAALGVTKRINLPSGKTLDVRIPPGTEDGRSMRLKGQGGPGRNGGPAGDAFVEIKVEPHSYFSRLGNDVLLDLPITLQEAVLGGKITVPTIDGKVAITVPPNSNSGTTLRLRGKGMPHDGGRGDQLVKLRIVLPDPMDKDLEAFVKRWADRNPYNPRDKM